MSDLETPYPRPLSGAKVTNLPSGLIPSRSNLEGQVVVLEPIDPNRHGTEVYAAGHGSPEADAIWDYLAYGPWPDEAAMTGWLRECAVSHDPMFFAIRPKDGGKAMDTLARLGLEDHVEWICGVPDDRIVELYSEGVGWFSKAND